ncbi:hypothetical protein D1BOALGB6SA_9875 [Olavius sp. associated proteobacterium Delta 1]|nr:hypothetical protein D1BOALGB6SA_9875 [Olavius sp. associated proteobacterium Delta 1]
MNHKIPVRFIPQMRFNTNYKRRVKKFEFEKWDGQVGAKTIHFEFLPENISHIKSGDCVLLSKSNLQEFIKTGLNLPPPWEGVYKFPEYIKNPPDNWKILTDKGRYLLYQVN